MSSSQIAPKPLQIVAAVIGNALEWYDFIVFGFFTVVIARLFFPSDNQYASLLLTTATFGVGFFMRPVGGVLLGIYADRRGRKAALLMVITRRRCGQYRASAQTEMPGQPGVWLIAVAVASIGFRAGEAHHFAPLLGFGGDERGEVAG
jgi:MFS family permease